MVRRHTTGETMSQSEPLPKHLLPAAVQARVAAWHWYCHGSAWLPYTVGTGLASEPGDGGQGHRPHLGDATVGALSRTRGLSSSQDTPHWRGPLYAPPSRGEGR